MKVTELKNRKAELLENFRIFHEIYFSEHPSYSPYLSYGEDSEGNATRAYIGVEDKNGNAVGAGIDEHLEEGYTYFPKHN